MKCKTWFYTGETWQKALNNFQANCKDLETSMKDFAAGKTEFMRSWNCDMDKDPKEANKVKFKGGLRM